MMEYSRRVMEYRFHLQIKEALGPLNRWYCCEHFGKRVEEEEALFRYYVRSGGAANFKKRFDEAMGKDNRWYCSEFYGREIEDPEILWKYYIEHARVDATGVRSRCGALSACECER